MKANKQTRKQSAMKRVQKTEYNIPTFGYKSAFLILCFTFFPLLIIPKLTQFIGWDQRFFTMIITACCSGFSVAYAQYYIENKAENKKSFWIVGCCVSLFVMLLLFLFLYANTLM